MSIALLLVVALAAMALVVSVSFLLFARLPRSALRLAEAHGRYAGLGSEPPAVVQPSAGHRAPAPVPSLRQAA